MRIRIFGRLIIIPTWLKYFFISVALVFLGVLGYVVDKKNSSGELSEFVPTSSPAIIAATPEANISTPAPSATEAVSLITVYIVGEITNSDVYDIPEGAILRDLVAAAGGLTENADRESVNLACQLKNGMMIRIPSIYDKDKTWIVDGGNSSSSAGTSGSASEGNLLVNINTADVTALCALPGIGESTALKIISYRTENGPFTDISEIMNVSGIKTARYNDIKNYITVG